MLTSSINFVKFPQKKVKVPGWRLCISTVNKHNWVEPKSCCSVCVLIVPWTVKMQLLSVSEENWNFSLCLFLFSISQDWLRSPVVLSSCILDPFLIILPHSEQAQCLSWYRFYLVWNILPALSALHASIGWALMGVWCFLRLIMLCYIPYTVGQGARIMQSSSCGVGGVFISLSIENYEDVWITLFSRNRNLSDCGSNLFFWWTLL